MHFNPEKCEAIIVSNKRNPIKIEYKIHGQTRIKVSSAKYLVVTIDWKLSWNTHIGNITKEANSTRTVLEWNTVACIVLQNIRSSNSGVRVNVIGSIHCEEHR